MLGNRASWGSAVSPSSSPESAASWLPCTKQASSETSVSAPTGFSAESCSHWAVGSAYSSSSSSTFCWREEATARRKPVGEESGAKMEIASSSSECSSNSSTCSRTCSSLQYLGTEFCEDEGQVECNSQGGRREQAAVEDPSSPIPAEVEQEASK